MARIPPQLTEGIRLDAPGAPRSGGSDYPSFVCTGAPALELGNTALIAIVAYMAADDPQRIPREKANLVDTRTGQPVQWPVCQQAARSSR
jgi:carboxypeptidase Q